MNVDIQSRRLEFGDGLRQHNLHRLQSITGWASNKSQAIYVRFTSIKGFDRCHTGC